MTKKELYQRYLGLLLEEIDPAALPELTEQEEQEWKDFIIEIGDASIELKATVEVELDDHLYRNGLDLPESIKDWTAYDLYLFARAIDGHKFERLWVTGILGVDNKREVIDLLEPAE